MASREGVDYGSPLEKWLPSFIETVGHQDDPIALRSFPLKQYLQESGRFEVPVDERLRLLALEVDPSAAWPRLYLAYCLHDLERWSEATDAYRQVPKDKFTGRHRAWRMESVNEQLADCMRRSVETKRKFRFDAGK